MEGMGEGERLHYTYLHFDIRVCFLLGFDVSAREVSACFNAAQPQEGHTRGPRQE